MHLCMTLNDTVFSSDTFRQWGKKDKKKPKQLNPAGNDIVLIFSTGEKVNNVFFFFFFEVTAASSHMMMC